MTINKLSFTITTKSNLFIGSSPTTFEIGGVDARTVVDYQGNPFIPGSSLKGILRRIVNEQGENISGGQEIKAAYLNYLTELESDYKKSDLSKIEIAEQEKNGECFTERKKEVSAAYLFGIEDFNQTPKLLFADVTLIPNQEQANLFSLDSKNSITLDKKHDKLLATPRTYQTVCPNVTFQGNILFQQMKRLSVEPSVIETFLKGCMELFNEGFYRLGNSGSRGYGLIEVSFKEEERL